MHLHRPPVLFRSFVVLSSLLGQHHWLRNAQREHL